MSLEKMVDQFKDVVELQAYAEAQTKTILELSRRLAKIEDEKKHLERLLADSTPLIEDQKKELLGYSVTDPKEKVIAEVQLNMLKEISFERELTIEEAKRVDIFAKILMSFRQKGVEKEVPSKTMTNEELMALAESLNVSGS
jgi:glutamyl/glutaminyl-tRNA synthetase